MGMDRGILEEAMWQFAADCGMRPEKGKKGQVRIGSRPWLPEQGHMTGEAYGELVREYMERETGMVPRLYENCDLFFREIVCMGEAWIRADERLEDWCRKEYEGKKPEWFGQFSDLKRLDRKLGAFGRQILDVRLHFLPSEEAAECLPAAPAGVEAVWYEGEGLEDLRRHYVFKHALCSSPLCPCMLAVAAVADGRPVGIAGATADCRNLWQIGVDVLPRWEGRGIGPWLTALLGAGLRKRGVIPFYAVSQSHTASMNTALRAGFLPAWSEVYVGRGRSL